MITIRAVLQEDPSIFAECVAVATRCRFNFSADEQERANGTFGFDQLTRKMLKKASPVQKGGNITALENIYTPIEGIGDDIYYVPWVSIRKGQTITLNLSIDVFDGDKLGLIIVRGNDEELFIYDFYDANGNLSYDIETAQKMTIRFRSEVPDSTTETTQLTFTIDGNPAGAINIFHPKPRQVNLKWYAIGRDDKEFDRISKDLKQNKLKKYFHKAFNPALIDINIVSPEPREINIKSERTELYNHLKQLTDHHIEEQGLEGKEKRLVKMRKRDDTFFMELQKPEQEERKARLMKLAMADGTTDISYQISKFALIDNLNQNLEINDTDPKLPPNVLEENRIKVIQTISSLRPDIKHSSGEVCLYIANIASYKKDDLADPKKLEINPGCSLIDQEMAFMFWGTKEVLPDLNIEQGTSVKFEPEGDIPHEVMHSLGLHHTFDPKQPLGVIFDQKFTDNYMDYQNNKIHTCKWQWEQMRSSHFCVPKTEKNE